MSKKGFIVNTDLDIITYCSIVDAIADECINEDGEYNPHYGELKAVSLFYNFCVTKSPYDEVLSHDISNAMDLKDIIADDAFLELYAEALADVRPGRLSFGNAYEYAMKIVDDKKSSVSRVISSLQNVLLELVDTMNSQVDENVLEMAEKFKNIMPNGQIDFEQFLKAYSESKMYKQIHSADNVIPIIK